ncbi:MAG: LysR family transcriptional regulator [Bdellovibrionota bacterium]
MDIDRVRYFHIFAETGSLVRASEILHISQPALSKALRLLEHEVGAKLVEAEGRGLRLTHSGVTFRKETAGLLDKWLQLPKLIQSEHLQAPTKIGSFEVFTTYFLESLTKFIKLENLELHEYIPGQLEEAIINGTVDIGITYAPIPKQGIEFIEVTKIRMGVFGLKKYKDVTLSELPFAVPLSPIEGTPSKVVGLDGWPDHKIPRNIKYRVTLMESAIELSREGHCVAYLPEFIVHNHNKKVLPEFKLIELESSVSKKDRIQSVFLIYRKHADESVLVRQLAKCLRSLS